MMTRRAVIGGIASAGAAAIAGPGIGLGAGRVNYASTGVGIIETPPGAEGYSMPAEWAPHERTLMQFLPPSSWYRRGSDEEWVATANAISEFEPVTMALLPRLRKRAEKRLSTGIEIIEMAMNDGWCRDSGPMVLTNGTRDRRVAGFEFNGWGGKYPRYGDDALVKARFAKHMDMGLHPVDLVLEGGAVHVDGEGTLLTTEECLLNSNRNPGKSKGEVEAILKDWLGIEKIIWLAKGLTPDPVTDGHIDGIAAFAAPGVVLLHTTDDRSDPNYAITMNAKRILEKTPDAKGRKLQVIEMPLTSWDVAHMNFYICNGGIIAPVSGKAKEDDQPLSILQNAFPKHKVVPVPGRLLAEGGGGVHCITQQVPAV